MKIGVDLDDVLLDCNTSLAVFHNSHYGTSYEAKDVFSWHLEQIWGCTRQEALARIKEWYISPEHSQSLRMPGSIEVVTELVKHHELHIITSRPEEVRDLTCVWLEWYFPKKFKSVNFTNHFESNARSKADICKDIGIPLLIEDSLVHARAVADAGITVLLLDSPWNQEKVDGNIIRIFKWKDVLEFVSLKEFRQSLICK